MTLKTTSRLAGFAFLFYIAIGIYDMALFGRASAGEGAAAMLANVARHATQIRISSLLELLMALCALTIAVTIYSITRGYDRELALLAMVCRVVEGANGARGAIARMQLLSVATAAQQASGPDAAAANALGLMFMGNNVAVSAILFAVGSTIYCYIFLRGRVIPRPMAWLGCLSSLLLVIALPAQVVLATTGGWLVWIPMALFEVALAVWLLVKGAAPAATAPAR